MFRLYPQKERRPNLHLAGKCFDNCGMQSPIDYEIHAADQAA